VVQYLRTEQHVRIIRGFYLIRSAVGCWVEVALYRREQLFNVVLNVGGLFLAVGDDELHTSRPLVGCSG